MAGQGGFDPQQLDGINDINITPFVDVVLVLLVIFIVTAPMMMKDIIGLKLPKASNSEAQSFSTLAIAITKNGQYLLNGELQSPESLAEKCREAASKNQEVQAIFSADVEAFHGDVVKAIDVVKSAGINQFAIQVEKTAP
jgi:biopolymer transport protein ExbD